MTVYIEQPICIEYAKTSRLMNKSTIKSMLTTKVKISRQSSHHIFTIYE